MLLQRCTLLFFGIYVRPFGPTIHPYHRNKQEDAFLCVQAIFVIQCHTYRRSGSLPLPKVRLHICSACVEMGVNAWIISLHNLLSRPFTVCFGPPWEDSFSLRLSLAPVPVSSADKLAQHRQTVPITSSATRVYAKIVALIFLAQPHSAVLVDNAGPQEPIPMVGKVNPSTHLTNLLPQSPPLAKSPQQRQTTRSQLRQNKTQEDPNCLQVVQQVPNKPVIHFPRKRRAKASASQVYKPVRQMVPGATAKMLLGLARKLAETA